MALETESRFAKIAEGRGVTNMDPAQIRNTLNGVTGFPVISTGIADLDCKAPMLVREKLFRYLDEGLTYRSSLPHAQERLSSWYQEQWGAEIKPEWILPVQIGAKGAIAILRDTLINFGYATNAVAPTPIYGGLLRGGRQATDARRVPLQENIINRTMSYNWPQVGMNSSLWRNDVLIICNPHNPIGRVWNLQELSGIHEEVKAAGAFVISDELHADIVHPGSKHVSWATIADTDAWAVVHGFGKAFAMSGLGTCHLIIPARDIRDLFIANLRLIGLRPGGLVPECEIRAVKEGCGDWLAEVGEYVAGRTDRLLQVLQSVGVKTTSPRAGFLVWANFGFYEEPVERRLLNELAIDCLGGARFGWSRHGFVRFNAALSDDLLDALQIRLDRCPDLVRDGG